MEERKGMSSNVLAKWHMQPEREHLLRQAMTTTKKAMVKAVLRMAMEMYLLTFAADDGNATA
jgi:hypothetical protein